MLQFRFKLRSLFIFITLAAIVSAMVVRSLYWINEREHGAHLWKLLQTRKPYSADFVPLWLNDPHKSLPILWRLFGAEPMYSEIVLDTDDDAIIQYYEDAYPEANVRLKKDGATGLSFLIHDGKKTE